MPYIKQDKRNEIKDIIHSQEVNAIETVGDLNYTITMICKKFMEMNGGISYTNVNSIIGVLDCAKQEFYRKVGAPYEDEKIKENGDVFD